MEKTEIKKEKVIVPDDIINDRNKFKKWFMKTYLNRFDEIPQFNTFEIVSALREEEQNVDDFFREVISTISIILHNEDISSSVYEKCRKREVVMIRTIASYIMCEKIGFKKVSVGRILGKDHSTIVHHCRTVRGYLKVDKKFEAEFNRIIMMLKSKKILNK